MNRLTAMLFAALLVVLRWWRAAEEERQRLVRLGDEEYRRRLSLEQELVRAHRVASEQEATMAYLADVGRATRRLIAATQATVDVSRGISREIHDLAGALADVQHELEQAGLIAWLPMRSAKTSLVPDRPSEPETRREGSAPPPPKGALDRLVAAAARLEDWQNCAAAPPLDVLLDELAAARKELEATPPPGGDLVRGNCAVLHTLAHGLAAIASGSMEYADAMTLAARLEGDARRTLAAEPAEEPIRLAVLEQLVEACRGLRAHLLEQCDNTKPLSLDGDHRAIRRLLARLDDLRIAGPRAAVDPVLYAPVGWTELTGQDRQNVQAFVDGMRASSERRSMVETSETQMSGEGPTA